VSIESDGTVSTESDGQQRYDIHLDDKYGSLTLIDVAAEAAAHDPWFNQTLTTVNDTAIRLGVIEGDLHFHNVKPLVKFRH
jgi:hypothetical protein